MRPLPGRTKSNSVLAWSPSGRFVTASGTGDGVMVWDVDAGTEGERTLIEGHGGEAMRFCPATGRLWVAFRSGGVWTLDPATGEERQRRRQQIHVGYTSPALSADGRTIVFRRSSYENSQSEYAIVGFAIADDGAIKEVWSRPDTGTVHGEARFDFTTHPTTGCLFRPAGSWGTARVFEWVIPHTGELVGSLALPPQTPIAQWVLAPDGEQVAWLAGHTIFIQRLTETQPRVFPAVAGEYRRGLAWSPDGRMLACAAGAAVRLLDSETLTEVRTFEWGTGKPRAIAFSPDGLRAAVSSDGGRGWVAVFDLE